MIDVLTKEYQDGEFTKAGTIDLVDGKVVFDIKDKELLGIISSAPPKVIKAGGERYLDHIKAQFAFSSTILLAESV